MRSSPSSRGGSRWSGYGRVGMETGDDMTRECYTPPDARAVEGAVQPLRHGRTSATGGRALPSRHDAHRHGRFRVRALGQDRRAGGRGGRAGSRALGSPGPAGWARGGRLPALVSRPASRRRTSTPLELRVPMGERDRGGAAATSAVTSGVARRMAIGCASCSTRPRSTAMATTSTRRATSSTTRPASRCSVAPRSRPSAPRRGPSTSSTATTGRPDRRSCRCATATPATRSWRGRAPMLTCHNLAFHGWTPRAAGLAARPARRTSGLRDGVDLLRGAIASCGPRQHGQPEPTPASR